MEMATGEMTTCEWEDMEELAMERQRYKAAETALLHERTAAENSANQEARRMKEAVQTRNLLYDKIEKELYAKRKEAIKKHRSEEKTKHEKALDTISPFSLCPSFSTEKAVFFRDYLKRDETKHSSNPVKNQAERKVRRSSLRLQVYQKKEKGQRKRETPPFSHRFSPEKRGLDREAN
jgi:hypothetical protein